MINNTTKTIFRSIRVLPCSALVALFSLHCVAAEDVSIVGKVYFEANVQISPGADATDDSANWNKDAIYDYTDNVEEENRKRVVISSGDVWTNPEANGNFTLKGKSIDGEFLIEVEAQGFQPAYVSVNHKDVEGDQYEQTTAPKETIRSTVGNIEYNDMREYLGGSCTVYGAPCATPKPLPAQTDQLDPAEGVVTILLLRNERSTDEDEVPDEFNVLKYTEPGSAAQSEGGGDTGPNAEAPVSVTDLTGEGGDEDGQVDLGWINPINRDFAKVSITWEPTGGPEQPITLEGKRNTAMRHTISGLEAGGDYTFTLVAMDSAGNESDPATVMAKAKGDVSISCINDPMTTMTDDYSCTRSGAVDTILLDTSMDRRLGSLAGFINTRQDIDYFKIVVDRPGRLTLYSLGYTDVFGWLEKHDSGDREVIDPSDALSRNRSRATSNIARGTPGGSCSYFWWFFDRTAPASCNDDAGIGLNFRIRNERVRVTPENEGIYYLRVKSWAECCTGGYTVVAWFVPDN